MVIFHCYVSSPEGIGNFSLASEMPMIHHQWTQPSTSTSQPSKEAWRAKPLWGFYSWVSSPINQLPSGELTFCYGKSPFLMGKSTINGDFQFSIVMLVYQRVVQDSIAASPIPYWKPLIILTWMAANYINQSGQKVRSTNPANKSSIFLAVYGFSGASPRP